MWQQYNYFIFCIKKYNYIFCIKNIILGIFCTEFQQNIRHNAPQISSQIDLYEHTKKQDTQLDTHTQTDTQQLNNQPSHTRHNNYIIYNYVFLSNII